MAGPKPTITSRGAASLLISHAREILDSH